MAAIQTRRKCTLCYSILPDGAVKCGTCGTPVTETTARVETVVETSPPVIPAKVKGVIKTYEEGGRGRKKCAKCTKFVAEILSACACGSTEFVQKAAVESPVYNEGGAGRKQCVCQKFVGVRTATCGACGHVFAKEEPPAPNPVPAAAVELEAPLPPPKRGPSDRTILTPAGPCPCKLESSSPEHVRDWKRRLLAHEPRLSNEAIIYYAATLFPASREHPKGHPNAVNIADIVNEG